MSERTPGLQFATIDPSKMYTGDFVMGGQEISMQDLFREPATWTGVIEWPKPNERPYPFVTNEIHIPLCGKAEYTYSAAPLHMEEHTREVTQGDVVLIRSGALLSIRPIEEPYRCVFVMMPTHARPDLNNENF